jgi:DNA polymerase III alpha subunit
LDQYKGILGKNGMVKSSAKIQKLPDRTSIMVPIFVEAAKIRPTKAGKQMLLIKGSDLDGNVEAVSFAQNMNQIYNTLDGNKLAMLFARTAVRDERVSIMVDRVMPLADWVAGEISGISMEIHDAAILTDLQTMLAALGNGHTRIKLSVHSGGKITTITLPKSYHMTAEVLESMAKLSPKMEMA